MPFSAILFDLDDTLIDFKKSEGISLRKCYANYFAHLSPWDVFQTHYNRVNRHLWDQAETGKIRTSMIGEMRFQEISNLYGVPYIPEIVQFYEEALVHHSEWIEGAEVLLETLQAHSIPIGFVTNGFTHLQREKERKLRLSRFSEIMIISEECGVAKPHPQIFHHALEKIQSVPGKTLMIGDSLSSDGQGAQNVQMPFCWYNPNRLENPHSWQPTLIVHTLGSCLPAIII